MSSTPTNEQADHKRHLTALKSAADKNGWRLVQDATMRVLDGSCLYSLAFTNRHYENYIFGERWEYVEVGFKARSQTGLNRLKQRTVHYCVMSVKLPRRLPNVVFDSTSHQKRQFRVIFDRKHRIQLEGNFNKYFVTYFAEDYRIDDLSFITPEVMEALIAARNYDIEIVHDSLLLFGPLISDPEKQISEMSMSLEKIRKKLLNNILTYRDERVPHHRGRQIVAKSGMFLKQRSPQSLFWLFLVCGFWIFMATWVLLGLYSAFTE